MRKIETKTSLRGRARVLSARASTEGTAQGALAFTRRTAAFAASTSLAGSLAVAGLVGSATLPGSDAHAQVADLCSGLSLNESVLRDRLVPLLQAVVNPIEATVDPLVGNVAAITNGLTTAVPILGPLLGGLPAVPALNLNVSGILGGVAAGAPLGIQVVAPDGTILGPAADCLVAADGFQLDGTQGLSIGGNSISGLGASGNAATAAEIDAIAFGDNASTGAGALGAMALGSDSAVGIGAVGGVAVGAGAEVAAGAVGSLALGAGASADVANSVALGAGSVTLRGAQTGYLAFGLDAPATSTGEVNVGGRTLTGLAAGQVAGDAVNVAQLSAVADDLGTGLTATATALGGAAAYDPVTGVFTPPTFALDGGAVIATNVGDALTDLDGRTTINTTDITNLTTDITTGAVGLVQQLAPGADLTVGAGTNGAAITFNQLGGATRLVTGLSAGSLLATSTDAVTGAQLGATNEIVADVQTGLLDASLALGGGASFDPVTGVFTPPVYVLDGGAATLGTVGDALTNLDGRTTINTTDITNLTNQVGLGTIGLVQQLVPGADLTVGAGTDGDALIVNQAGGGTRLVTGLTAGAAVAGSTDAVTGGQLADTNAALDLTTAGVVATAGALGAGAAFDPLTGTFTAPAYSLDGGAVVAANVGDAIGNLDGRVTTNTTDITNLTNQVGSGTIGLVQQLAPGADLTVGAGTDGAAVVFNQAGGATRLVTGLTAGSLAAGSTDAVTGEQLGATNEIVADVQTGLLDASLALGGGASFDPVTGVFAPPTYILDSGAATFANVGDALGNLDGRVTVNTTDIANITTQIGSGAIGLVQQLDPGANLTVGAGTDGDAVVFNQLGGGTRLVTGLTAGAAVAGSTDAVTGGQLAATNAGLSATAGAIGAGAAFDPLTGIFTAPSFVLDGGTVTETTVGGAVINLDGRVTTLADLVVGGGIGLVQQAGPGANLTVGAGTDGAAVVFNQLGGATRLVTGLSAGTVAAGSTDAVTGAQLAATNAALGQTSAGVAATAGALGGGAGFDPATGVFTAPAYSLDGGAVVATNVGDAIGNLDGRTSANTTAIVDLSTQVNTGAVGLVRQAAPGANLTVGAATDGDAVAFNQAGGATRLVTGLSAGSVAAGSTDAVTGGQAFATAQSVASALGGGAAVTPAGTISAPTYDIGGTGFTDAGSAFAALDDSVTALQNQVGAFNPDGSLAFISVNTTAGPARATGAESIASGGGAFASGANTVAYGSNSAATGANSSAYGANASATGANASAFGAGSSAGFDNSAAFGAGASASRSNQIAFGTASNTYSMAGITSDASRAAQSGPLDLVTTDAAGNLGSLPLSDFFSGMSGIEGRLNEFDRKFDRQSDGIAIAMALGAVALPADKSFALTGSVGYFDDTAAFGIGAIGQIADNWYVNGGVGVGTERGTVAGRAGLTFAW